jgi:hypothetical protein
LGADGLLVLETGRLGTNQFVDVRLIAVKPGVQLSGERFGWPLTNSMQWAAVMAKRLAPFLPKLGVLAKDAIPVSIVNLRSAIQSTEAREAERELTLLAIERLSREQRLFVLERRNLQLLAAEKELKGLDESAFWSGSYLLDGTLDSGGYSPEVITINGRLIPPKGGAVIPIVVSGSRTNFAEVVDKLTAQVLEGLKLGKSHAPWNARDEAEQFYTEAQWALKWQLYPQAQAAAESAWALGKENADAASLLVRAYAESIPEYGMNQNEIMVLQVPDSSEFAPLDRGLEFFLQNTQILFSTTNSFRAFKLGLRLLNEASGLLENYYYAAEMRADHAEALVALREKMRQTFNALNAHPLMMTNQMAPWEDPRQLFAKLEWDEGGMAFEQPEEALGFYRNLLNAGMHPEQLPRIIGWSWADRQRVPTLLRRFASDACTGTNPAIRMEGLYFTLLLTPDDEQGDLRHSEETLAGASASRATKRTAPSTCCNGLKLGAI